VLLSENITLVSVAPGGGRGYLLRKRYTIIYPSVNIDRGISFDPRLHCLGIDLVSLYSGHPVYSRLRTLKRTVLNFQLFIALL